MKINLKKLLQSNPTTSKNFDYKLGEVGLNFSLRIDIKQQLKDFLECLKKAQEDVEAEIKKI